jgi:hypothetical protein
LLSNGSTLYRYASVPEPSPNTDPTTPAEAESNSFVDYEVGACTRVN